MIFEHLGALVYRHRWLTLIAAGGFLLISLLILLRGGDLTSGVIKGLESERAQPLIEKVLGYSLDQTFVAIFQSPDLDPDDDDFQTALKAALAPVRSDPAVAGVVTPEEAPPMLELSRVNNAARAVMVLVSLRGDFKQALHRYGPLRERLRSDRLTITCTGRIPFLHDLDTILEHDLLRAEAVSLPIALLLLLLVFGGVVAAVLPVGVGGLAVAGGMAVVFLLSRRLDIAQYTINVCSLIGLGVAIDYSLFIVSRYREELAAGLDTPHALSRAVATAGRMVAFSGLAVGSGMAGLLFFENSYLWAMGLGGAIVVALAIVFALTFLPALLAVLGPRIHAGRIPGLRLEVGAGFWHRTATWVMHRPVRVLVPTLAVLLLMGIPFLHLRMIASDVRVLPLGAEARHGYELLKKDFPDQAEPRILVPVAFPTAPALNSERIGALFDLSRRIAAIPHARKVESIVDGAPFNTKEDYLRMLFDPPKLYGATVAQAEKLTVSDRVVLLSVLTDLPPESKEAHRVVEAIREKRQVADGELLVGGQTANDVDAAHYILSRTPRAVGFVVSVMLVILFLLLGSVILPLKAVAMNFVSVAGSFGALVWVFQDGHLFIHEPRPVEPSLPILLFCILFGLSMDYEVLMLTRIKESYDRTGDNTLAVAEGLEKTAGLITSAAAIMVAVFGAFALASVVLVKAVGFGMALAVALDATLVRVLLVPATMRLFGDLNWWAPGPLVKLRRFLGLDAPHG